MGALLAEKPTILYLVIFGQLMTKLWSLKISLMTEKVLTLFSLRVCKQLPLNLIHMMPWLFPMLDLAKTLRDLLTILKIKISLFCPGSIKNEFSSDCPKESKSQTFNGCLSFAEILTLILAMSNSSILHSAVKYTKVLIQKL